MVLATFGYDDKGNRTSLARGNGTSTSYTPDAVSRLQTLTQTFPGSSANSLTLGFGYNPAGQIVSTAAPTICSRRRGTASARPARLPIA